MAGVHLDVTVVIKHLREFLVIDRVMAILLCHGTHINARLHSHSLPCCLGVPRKVSVHRCHPTKTRPHFVFVKV